MIININGVQVACFLDWFRTMAGIVALCIAVPLAFIGAALSNYFDRQYEEEENYHG